MKNGFIRKKYYEKALPIVHINGQNVVYTDQHVLHCRHKFRYGSNVNENVDIICVATSRT